MARTVSIGNQDFRTIIENHYFYVDKTDFIREWWDNGDTVTLITRPRRFGKTLTMSMVEAFFSIEYANRSDLFDGLSIWQEERYRELQGTYPVISLSFANVKDTNYQNTREKLCQLIASEYARHSYLLEGNYLTEQEKDTFRRKTASMGDVDATLSINQLSEYMCRYYGKKVIILLDEYDTPLQEAYVHGYWEELVAFTRNLFNATFKTNPYLNRGLMTGITRISKESIFSDFNNPEVVSVTSLKYQDCFGFNGEEVSDALKEYGLSEKEGEVREWYDGFSFGNKKGIYNPWSIINYLDKRVFSAYWANTSSNSLVSSLIRSSNRRIKECFEDLLKGKTISTRMDEHIVFSQLTKSEKAIWSLLLAGGYLKVTHYEAGKTEYGNWEENYELELTNFEVKVMFQKMISGWFEPSDEDYNDFVMAMLQGDMEAMNAYMNRISETIFSSFDTGKRPSDRTEPERFYHGLVLGLMVDLNDRYIITSNRESGFGRYDVQMEPRRTEDDAILLEFKVRNPKKEHSLEETLQNALAQIEERDYAAGLRQRGIEEERIRKYGFAFEGKKVLIG